MSDPQADQSR